jgi:hypothetical protein
MKLRFCTLSILLSLFHCEYLINYDAERKSKAGIIVNEDANLAYGTRRTLRISLMAAENHVILPNFEKQNLLHLIVQ